MGPFHADPYIKAGILDFMLLEEDDGDEEGPDDNRAGASRREDVMTDLEDTFSTTKLGKGGFFGRVTG